MAKKVATFDDENEEKHDGHVRIKKRSKCCTCCLVFCIVTLVILAAAFGIGWYFGDKFTRQELGLSLGDTLGVIGDLYWTDDGDVVKRPYSNKDLDGFYSEIKRNVLLKDNADVDFDKALDDAVRKYFESLETGGESVQSRNAGDDVGSDGTGDESESEIMDIFVDMIAGVLNRDNIDIERLNAYDENDPSTDEYIFSLNDKQLAAFVNTVLRSVLKSADKIESLNDISGMIDVSKIVALKQIRFKAKDGKTESGETEVVASSADITLWLGLQNAANQAIKYQMNDIGFGWAGGFVGWLGDVFLPENVYVTLNVPLFGDEKAKIVINDMDSSEQARANKLINGILSMTGNNKKLDDLLDDFVDIIKPYLEKATDKMDFSAAGKGTISLDFLQTVTEMASDVMGSDEPLGKADLIYVLQALLSDMTDKLTAITPYRYDNWYNEGGKEVYRAEGGNPANKIDYERAFIREIENKYAIDLGESGDLTEVLKMLGISLDGNNSGNIGSDDLLDKVDSTRFKELLDAPSSADITLSITDRMLGAALSKQTDKLVQGNENLENLSVSLDALTFVSKSGKPDHKYALIAAEIDLTELLDSVGTDKNALVTKLVGGLMPESVLLTATVDITRDRSVRRDETEFMINSCDNTDRAVATLEKLIPDLKLGEIVDKLSQTLNDMLDELDSRLRIELVSATYTPFEDGWIGDSGALVMPDIFTVVTDMVLVEKQPDGTQRPVVTPEELKNVIKDLNAPGVVESDIPSGGYSGFIDEVMSKYYFTQDPAAPVRTFDDLTKYMSDFDSNKFVIDGRNGLAHDDRTIDELVPVMSGGELGALIKEQLGGNSLVAGYDIVSVTTGENELGVVLAIELGDLLEGAAQVRKLIDAHALYVTATFDLDETNLKGDGSPERPFGYDVELKVNIAGNGGSVRYMTDETFDAMLRIVAFFMPSFDIQKQMDEVGVILYEKMQELNDSIASAGDGAEVPDDPSMPDVPETSNADKYFRFTARGLEIVDFYTFLALKLKPELLETSSAETIKTTVQGLYAFDPATPNDDNYTLDDIIHNAPSDTAWNIDDTFGKPHLDTEFNAFLKDGVEGISSEGDITVEQTVILAKGDESAKAQEIRAWLNGNLKRNDESDYITSAGDFMAITFSMSMENYIGKDKNENGDALPSDNIAVGLFPQKIYATVVFEYDGNRFNKVPEQAEHEDAPALIFNNMDYDEYQVMIALMGATPDSTDKDKVNIVSVTNKCEQVLNDIKNGITVGGHTYATDISFAPATVPTGKNAVGQISITPKS